jgi:hypothetical protein
MTLGAFHVHEDTLATGLITGSVALTAARAQIDLTALIPAGWVSVLELRVYGVGNWVFAAADNNAAECIGPDGIWFPLPMINAHQKVWFRGAGVTLYFAAFGKTRLETA